MPSSLPRGCRLIDFHSHLDSRGSLSVAESRRDIPFAVERVFWIYGVPEGQCRGQHSHNECCEVVVPVAGAFTMMLDDGTEQASVRMDSPAQGILVPPAVWCRLQDFAPGTVCVVFASHPYNAAGYTHDYDEYRSSIVRPEPYTAAAADEWNALVAASKNGTFLLDRRYMDYHADRFRDCSLLFRKRGTLIAALPASYDADAATVVSHGGLTYGPLLLSPAITAVETLEVFAVARHYYRHTLGAERWIYKPVPHIYHRQPSDEDLYALFRSSAAVVARGVSSVVDLSQPLPMRELRRRGARRADREGLRYVESDDYAAFWPLLTEVLESRHGRQPVHTLEEIQRLHAAFPDRIRLFLALKDGQPVAGTVLYLCDPVIHAQYIAASPEGRTLGALDGLFTYLIGAFAAESASAKDAAAPYRYFDFGISTEQGGSYLNEGLLFQKEGFGARAVVYDHYEMKLTDN